MKMRVIAFSENGCRTSLRLKEAFPDEDIELFCKTTHDNLGITRIKEKTSEWVGTAFRECDSIVFVGAIGIAVRYIAPYIQKKDVDPAVISMDEHATFIIPLLSGHIGGSNKLAGEIADRLDSTLVLTTATDINGKFSVDTFAVENGLHIESLDLAKDTSARILNDRFVGFCSRYPVSGNLPMGLTVAEEGVFGVCISPDIKDKPFKKTLNLVPKDVYIGLGCKRGVSPRHMAQLVKRILEENNIDCRRVAALGSITLKSDEPAILRLSEKLNVPVSFYTAEELNAIEGTFSESPFVKKITSVDCVCERSSIACGGKELVVRKTLEDGATVAVSINRKEIGFI